MKKNYTGFREEKNKYIKQLIFFNMVSLFLSIVIFNVWFLIIFTTTILFYFFVIYLRNKKNNFIKTQHEVNATFNEKEFSILELNAGIIYFQLFIVINAICLNFELSILIRILLILPLALLATVLEGEYKKNTKFKI